MLTIPTPATVRPHVEGVEGRGRTYGAVGILLDPDVIEAQVRVMHPELTIHQENAPRVDAGQLLLLRSPIGEVAVIGTEGVGDAVPEDSIDIPMFVAIGWQYQSIKIPATVVEEAMTSEGMDVADFVRVFGDRLDNNAYIWRRFVGVK